MKTAGDQQFLKARSLHQNGKLEDAVKIYRKVLRKGQHPHAQYLLGVALTNLKRFKEAIKPLQQHVDLRPDHLQTWLTLGDANRGIQDYASAEKAYRKVLDLESDNLFATIGICALYSDQENWEKLQEFSDDAAIQFPESEKLLRYRLQPRHFNRAFVEGLDLCVDFLIKNPESKEAIAWYNELYHHLKRPSNEFIERLKEINSLQGKSLYIRALIRAREIEAAKVAYDAFKSEDAESKVMSDVNMGLIFKSEELSDEAESYFIHALEDNPMDDNFIKMLVENLLDMAKKGRPEKFQEARELAQVWLNTKPDNTDALSTMGAVLMAASRPELALPYYNKLIEENPRHQMRASRLFSINYDEHRTPRQIYDDHRSWGELYESDRTPEEMVFEVSPDPEKRLRIGYVSPDLGFHPVGTFFIKVLKNHNFENFDIYLYSNRYSDEGDDLLSQEFRESVGEEHWRWTRGMNDEDLKKLILKDRIDILVDLAGHTAHNRLDVLSKRAAPVQVSWLGYPNTTGLTSVDFRLSDEITEPEGEFDKRSTEKIYRLPNGFHVFRIPEHTPAVAPAPCLKNGYITFGTYNNMNKLGSSSIALWAELLKAVPKSRILIKHKTLGVLDNREALRSNFAMHGIPAWRVQLQESTAGHKEHLESYGLIDIALDPLHYNGTTTSCDALSIGVPILTLPGGMHASRVTASLMHRIGLNEWIADDRKEFVDIGIKASHNPEMLNAIRPKIREAFLQSPLQDGPLMARDIETAFRYMWKWRCDKNVGKQFITVFNQKAKEEKNGN